MEKHIIDENTGIGYTLNGEYYLPDLTLLEEEEREIGAWGQRHLRYIREHRKGFYAQLVMTGKLNSYLLEVDQRAEDTFSSTIKQMAEREGVTEIKADDQMEWVRRMNGIRQQAIEIVNSEVIYI